MSLLTLALRDGLGRAGVIDQARRDGVVVGGECLNRTTAEFGEEGGHIVGARRLRARHVSA